MLSLDRKSTIKTLESNVKRIDYLPHDYNNIIHMFKNENDIVDIPLSDIAISFCENMGEGDIDKEIYKFDNSKSEDKLEYYCNHCIIYEQNLKNILSYIIKLVTYKVQTGNKNYTFFIIDNISNCNIPVNNIENDIGSYHEELGSMYDMTKTQYNNEIVIANIQTLLQITNSFIIVSDMLVNTDHQCNLIGDLIYGTNEKYQGPSYLRFLSDIIIRFTSYSNGVIAYIRSKRLCNNYNDVYALGPNEDINDTIKEAAEFIKRKNKE